MGNKILATYERVAFEKQEGQIAQAVNCRPWSEWIEHGGDISALFDICCGYPDDINSACAGMI